MPASMLCLRSLCWSHVCTPERCVEEIRRVLNPVDPSGPTGRDPRSACASYFLDRKRESAIPDREIINMFRGM